MKTRYWTAGLPLSVLLSLWFGFSQSAFASQLCHLGPEPGDTVIPEQIWEPEMRDWGTIVTQESGALVNVRSGPGTDYQILGQLQDGDRVIMAGYAMDSECTYTWYRLMVATGDPAYPVAYVWIRGDYFQADYGRGLFWF